MANKRVRNPKFALIKLIGGKDDGKYTSCVPTEWVRGFDYQEFLQIDNGECYIVEWHTGKKPLGGWPGYDGQVIEVSGKTLFPIKIH